MMVMRYKVGEGVRGPQSTGGGSKSGQGGSIWSKLVKIAKKVVFPSYIAYTKPILGVRNTILTPRPPKHR